MNFFEAMEAMRVGKIVESALYERYEFRNGIIYYSCSSGQAALSPREINGKWKIVEPEKPKVKKWMWAYRHDDGSWGVSTVLRTESEVARVGFKEYRKYGEPIEVEE